MLAWLLGFEVLLTVDWIFQEQQDCLDRAETLLPGRCKEVLLLPWCTT